MVMAQWIGEMAKGRWFANVPLGDMETAEQPNVVHFHNRPETVPPCKGPTAHAVPPASIAALTRILISFYIGSYHRCLRERSTAFLHAIRRAVQLRLLPSSLGRTGIG